MTYAEWLDTLVSPISSFVDWLLIIANNLIHNYFVITLLGICLFVSLVWCIFYFIFDVFDKINNRYDDFNDKYYNYELSQEVKQKYLQNNRNEVFDYLYDYTILKYQVLNGIYQNHRDLLVDNKIHALQINIDAIKSLKSTHLSDDDDSNDDDVDMIIPNPPIQQATIKELKSSLQKSNLEELKQDIENSKYWTNLELNKDIDKFNKETLNKIGVQFDLNNGWFDINTGEIISVDDVLSRLHNNNDRYLKDDFKLHDSTYDVEYIENGVKKVVSIPYEEYKANLNKYYGNSTYDVEYIENGVKKVVSIPLEEYNRGVDNYLRNSKERGFFDTSIVDYVEQGRDEE